MPHVDQKSFTATTNPHGESLSPQDAIGEMTTQKLHKRRGVVQNFMKWAGRVPEPKGVLDLEQYAFQKLLYSQEGAMHPEIAIKKATQVGVSTWLLRWVLFHCDAQGLNALYLFPKRQQMYDFSIAQGEKVLMADGTHRSVEDVRAGDSVMSFDGQRVVPDTVVRAWANGIQPIIRTELVGGRQIRSTPWHRLWTPQGWVKAGDLRVGDQVAVSATLPHEGTDATYTADEAFLLALWLAEGSKTRAGFTVTSNQPVIRARVKSICERRGWDLYEAKRGTMALTKKWAKKGDTPANLLRRSGLRGMSTETIYVPRGIMAASPDVAAEFLRTYIATDGSVDAKGVRIASASERLVRDLLIMGARFGAAGTVTSYQPAYKESHRSWSVNFYRRSSREALERMEPVDGSGAVEWREITKRHDELDQPTFDLETEEHHAFLTEGAVTHNSDARVKTAIEGSPYLMKRIPAKHVNNKGLKRIGTGHLYARGSESKDDLQSVDADCLAMDEYDDLRQENVPDAERRLSGSRDPRIRRVGVPSLPNYGISRIYDASDQRRWVVQCGKCNLRQPLTYDDNVDEARALVVCRGWKGDRREGLSCREPLDVRVGEWVATYPDRDKIGFHMPRLIVAHTNIAAIVDAHKRTSPTEKTTHYNKDLAEAYAAEEGRLSDEAIEAATREDLPPDAGEPYGAGNLITMGVDTAGRRNLHVRISEHKNEHLKLPLFVGEVESFSRVKELMIRFGVNMCVIDHLPETRLAMQLADEFPGRVFLAHFATLKSGVLDVREELREVAVHRVALLDMTFDRIRQQRTLLPDADRVHADYKDHLQGLHRVTGLDDKGNKLARYDSTGSFDFAMAEAYDQLAAICWDWRQATREGIQGQTTPFEEVYELDREHLDNFDPQAGDEYGGGFE